MPDPASPPNGEKKEPVIYTIPEQFYGTAAKADLPRENAVIAPKPPLPPPPPAIRPPAPAAKPSGPLKPASKKWLIIPILAVILIVAMGLVAWIYVRSLSKPAPVTPVVTLPEPEPEPVPEPVPEPATTTPELPPDPDMDKDGLTNSEEALYGTSATSTDSDADGYADSLEVINLYNPAGFKPTKLIEANLVKIYESAKWGFAALIPSTWNAVDTHPEDGDFVLEVTTRDLESNDAGGRAFTVLYGGERESRSLRDIMMIGENHGFTSAQLIEFKTKSGLDGIMSPDGKEALIDANGKIFHVRNSSAIQNRDDEYRATFTMFLNSFAKKP